MRDHRVEIFVPDLPEPASHYVHVVRAGQMVFVSGCSALDAEGRTRPASTLVEVAGFSRPDILVEIEAIAVVPAATSPWGVPSEEP
jgi:enamine deaminase RidA (YjgF/YER057c/UK114 family)